MVGHNYVLTVVTGPLDERLEAALEERVMRCLIQKLDSSDLGLHVDFLKGIEMNEAELLKAFWGVLSNEVPPIRIRSLSLKRDKKTRVTLSAD